MDWNEWTDRHDECDLLHECIDCGYGECDCGGCDYCCSGCRECHGLIASEDDYEFEDDEEG